MIQILPFVTIGFRYWTLSKTPIKPVLEGKRDVASSSIPRDQTIEYVIRISKGPPFQTIQT